MPGIATPVPAPGPALIFFRTGPRFTAAAPALAWLTRGVFLRSGARRPDRARLRYFEVI